MAYINDSLHSELLLSLYDDTRWNGGISTVGAR
jgi:hypothetical protein